MLFTKVIKVNIFYPHKYYRYNCRGYKANCISYLNVKIVALTFRNHLIEKLKNKKDLDNINY